jgi:hypothetical protein
VEQPDAMPPAWLQVPSVPPQLAPLIAHIPPTQQPLAAQVEF